MTLSALAKSLSLKNIFRRRSLGLLPTAVAKVVPVKEWVCRVEGVMASSTDAVAEKMAAMGVAEKKAGKKGGDTIKEVSDPQSSQPAY